MLVYQELCIDTCAFGVNGESALARKKKIRPQDLKDVRVLCGTYEYMEASFEEMLKELQDKGYFLAMATSKPEAFADIVLRHFHIRDYIKVMAGATMDEGRTNKAEVLAYALEQMNISDLSEAVMVGDRSYDVKGAQAMGIDSVGVLYGYGSREELEEAVATKIAKSVEDLKNILLNWK